MSNFDLLHPALQHHVVNSLGWRTLRPLQENAIALILAGKHALMLAPTAGGKTEAALFPLFSRLLFENWTGLSILYVCPIKALLNNLNDRLNEYTSLIGRRSAVWHGDISESTRKKIIADPPDCLLTTPESIEAMLISSRTDNMALFENLYAVVVDEIHAFAGDDRGWHLLAVLERLTILAGREMQRIGLSATVGNPKELLHWLAGHCKGDGAVLLEDPDDIAVDVKLDFVGNLENAAIVLSRLYAGEKRLVFCDSRARVEQLAHSLRKKGVNTFVSHSSLSPAERQRSEAAFRNEKDCVIAATSTLELGIDIGDLDHVIQIDAPSTVSSFLQRLGRTGRRKGNSCNCLFLATSDQGFLQAAALIHLWTSGYVEPVDPPPCPYHVFTQQILGILLQEKGMGINTWKRWIGRIPVFGEMPDKIVSEILQHMLKTDILSHDQGVLWFGEKGEKIFGFRNFMELCSVFTSPPLYTVKHGRNLIGYVDEITFADSADKKVILLGGRGWSVSHIDRDKRIAAVEPTKEKGRSRWLGAGPHLSFVFCQAIKHMLSGGETSRLWSKRAVDKMNDLQEEYQWNEMNKTTLLRRKNSLIWWTFAGKIANLHLAAILNSNLKKAAYADNLSIKINSFGLIEGLKRLWKISPNDLNNENIISAFLETISHYKFHECLTENVMELMAQTRFSIIDHIKNVLRMPISLVDESGSNHTNQVKL